MAEFNFTFRTLSPLHIGTGDSIDPFSYVMVKKTIGKQSDYEEMLKKYKNNPKLLNKLQDKRVSNDNHTHTLYCFDIYKLMDSLDTVHKQYFLSQNNHPSKVSVKPLMKFLSTTFDYSKHKNAVVYKYEITPSIYQYYYEKMQDQELNNMLSIDTITRSQKAIPYIPGTTIKGAFRNAFFKYNNLIDDMEIDVDPFRLLIVNDAINTEACKIGVYFTHKFNTQLSDNKFVLDSNISNQVECVKENEEFNGNITLNRKFYSGKLNKKVLKSMENNFSSSKDIINMLNKAYGNDFEKTYKKFSHIYGNKHPFIVAVNNIKNKRDKDTYAFIQLGKYGGKYLKVSDNNEEGKQSKIITMFATKKIKSDDLMNVNIENDYPIHPAGWVAVYSKD